MLVRSIIAATAALLLVAPAAHAQDTSAPATFGSVRLSSGFTPDPHSVSLTAGGTIDASTIGSPCTGSIARAPDYELTYSAGSLPLYISATASSDTTLVVNGPDGRWYCDDDTNGNNPLVTFNNPRSGTYDIWVGVYGGGTAAATLSISELYTDGYGGGGGGGGYPDTSARATFGEIYLNSGFTPDPHRVSITAGGLLQASVVSSDCAGSIATAPDYQITYTAGSLPLAIQTQSGMDTTLVVNGPDGEWYCDDDSGDGNNAQVYFSRPSSGVYDIWVGTYGGGNASATLLITEVP
ncbi:peptidase [Brevundimonas sp. FT23028]|uniref:peptidase n=1 Tax=Brevundimonas sp. FT23028 TaxID=3393748 RepID=UPI003B586C7D